MRRRRGIVRFGVTGPSIAGTVGSLAVLVAFAFGVPIILVAERAGFPVGLLEGVFTHPSSLLHSVGRPVTDTTVLHVVIPDGVAGLGMAGRMCNCRIGGSAPRSTALATSC